jgi:hypothetical protein
MKSRNQIAGLSGWGQRRTAAAARHGRLGKVTRINGSFVAFVAPPLDTVTPP